MDPSAEIAAYKVSVDTNVTTKTAIDSISPVDVGDIGTDLADLILPYLLVSNNQTISGGTTLPSDLIGEDLDIYYRINGTTFYVYRKESGSWDEKVNLTIGVTLPDGPFTIRASISGFAVTVIPGAWIIDNVIYQKATSTGLTVNAADLNFSRYDLIYGDTSGNVQYLAGTAASSPAFPTTPANSVVLDYVIVPSSSSGNNPYLFYSGSGSVNSNERYVTGTSDINGEYDASAEGIRQFPVVTIYDENGLQSPAQYDNANQKFVGMAALTDFTARVI